MQNIMQKTGGNISRAAALCAATSVQLDIDNSIRRHNKEKRKLGWKLFISRLRGADILSESILKSREEVNDKLNTERRKRKLIHKIERKILRYSIDYYHASPIIDGVIQELDSKKPIRRTELTDSAYLSDLREQLDKKQREINSCTGS